MQKMMTVSTTSLDTITFDGSDLWVSDVIEKRVKKVSISEQRILKEIKFLAGGIPKAMTFANDSLVVVNFNPETRTSGEMIQINVMNGMILRTLPCPPNIDSGVIFDNHSFWASSSINPSVTRFHPATGEILEEISMDFPVMGMTLAGDAVLLAFDKSEKEKCYTISAFERNSWRLITEQEVASPITGLCYAENMIFYNDPISKEIQVTRLKLG